MTTDTEEQSLPEFRMERFQEMGFSYASALALAYAKGANGWPVDRYVVQRMLDAGRPHTFVVEMFCDT